MVESDMTECDWCFSREGVRWVNLEGWVCVYCRGVVDAE